MMTNSGKNHLIVAAILAILAIMVASLINSRQAVAQNPNPGSAPVNIVSPLPLPVTGTTSVAGTVNVNVVNPVSSPALVRDVDNAARHPFQIRLCAESSFFPPLCTVTPSPTVPSSFVVPSSQRLVVEYISGLCIGEGFGAPGDALKFPDGGQATLSTTAGGVGAEYHLHLVQQGFGFAFDVTQPTYISADPGSTVVLGVDFVCISGSCPNPKFGCLVSLSGHTVTP